MTRGRVTRSTKGTHTDPNPKHRPIPTPERNFSTLPCRRASAFHPHCGPGFGRRTEGGATTAVCCRCMLRVKCEERKTETLPLSSKAHTSRYVARPTTNKLDGHKGGEAVYVQVGSPHPFFTNTPDAATPDEAMCTHLTKGLETQTSTRVALASRQVHNP